MYTQVDFSESFKGLFEPFRYKIFYGGRGGAKSWHFAIALLLLSCKEKRRILCTREYQSSINESVQKLLVESIERMNLSSNFVCTEKKIVGKNGSEFLFHGLRHDINKIKSLENIAICWVEEGHSVSKKSWETLIPTIRKEGSEIWVSFNPDIEENDTYQRFVKFPQENSLVKKVTYRDNPWFPKVLMKELENCKKNDFEAYLNIWEGECQNTSEKQIFRNKYEVLPFESPLEAAFYHGADWGFAVDPTVLIRAFVQENTLYVDYEAYGLGVELDKTANLFDIIPTARTFPIKADSSRPETIQFMKKRGFNITGAKKWGGSVLDGIGILKSFDKIIIHPRCVHTINEAKLYSYKTDNNTGKILPYIEDANNHCFDALRYALDDYIKGRIPMKFRK